MFKPNIKILKTFILQKLLHRFHPNLAQWQRPTSAAGGWSHVHPKIRRWQTDSKFSGGKNIENCHISATIQPISTKFGTMMNTGPQDHVSRRNSQRQSKMTDDPILNTVKLWYLCNNNGHSALACQLTKYHDMIPLRLRFMTPPVLTLSSNSSRLSRSSSVSASSSFSLPAAAFWS